MILVAQFSSATPQRGSTDPSLSARMMAVSLLALWATMMNPTITRW
ncbi:hypothetical protein OROHE_008481 [Orobanche hederae]